MAIVTIFTSGYCRGEDVAQGLVETLTYQRLEDAKIFAVAEQRFGMEPKQLSRAMHEPPGLFNSITRGREKGIAYLRAAILDCIEGDDLVYLGFGGHLLPDTLTHVLRVCLVAEGSYRVQQAVKSEGVSKRKAAALVRRRDEQSAMWTETLCRSRPYDPRLYDVVLPMHETPVEEAVERIVTHARKPVLHTTAVTARSLDDAKLAARVSVHLVEQGQDVDVTAVDGHVGVLVNEHTIRLQRYLRELEDLARQVDGVNEVEAKPGPRYREPDVYAPMEFEVPSRVLLVDDEREFVEALSERLQTRDFDTSIAYNGEDALDRVADHEHDVLVLDLKMPGIDGIEVLRRVKRDHPGIEVIILTGHGSEREREQAEALGAHAYLRKPVDIDVLTEQMKTAYEKINARNTAAPEDEDEGEGNAPEDAGR